MASKTGGMEETLKKKIKVENKNNKIIEFVFEHN